MNGEKLSFNPLIFGAKIIALLYRLFIALYAFAIRIAAFWNAKARLWVAGRKVFPEIPDTQLPRIWMHCASLGEFEQGRPVLEQLRRHYPHHEIVLSFFSPSGYTASRSYAGADHIVYLPMDTPANARRFIDVVRPSLVLWVKYEYWFYYLSALQERRIPVLLISGIFRPGQPFFAWYGARWRKILQAFTALFVQTPEAAALLHGLLGQSLPIIVSGDTRFDRVLQIVRSFAPIAPVAAFCEGHRVVVAGSTWEEDETELIHYVRQHPELRFIIAPHEIDAANIAEVSARFPGSMLYSHWEASGGNGHVLIIDNIGMLSRLYHYATITYVGGGFGDDGVHNVLEAAVYGKPVVFGPEYEKYVEAEELVAVGGAFSIAQALELEALLDRLLGDAAALEKAGTAAGQFVAGRAGATDTIIGYIQENRLLTN